MKRFFENFDFRDFYDRFGVKNVKIEICSLVHQFSLQPLTNWYTASLGQSALQTEEMCLEILISWELMTVLG